MLLKWFSTTPIQLQRGPTCSSFVTTYLLYWLRIMEGWLQLDRFLFLASEVSQKENQKETKKKNRRPRVRERRNEKVARRAAASAATVEGRWKRAPPHRKLTFSNTAARKTKRHHQSTNAAMLSRSLDRLAPPANKTFRGGFLQVLPGLTGVFPIFNRGNHQWCTFVVWHCRVKTFKRFDICVAGDTNLDRNETWRKIEKGNFIKCLMLFPGTVDIIFRGGGGGGVGGEVDLHDDSDRFGKRICIETWMTAQHQWRPDGIHWSHIFGVVL